MFGRDSAIYPGPAALALKSGAALLFGVMERQPDLSYSMVFHEIRTDDLSSNTEEAVKISVKAYYIT